MSGKTCHYKLVLLGDTAVGKSCLVVRFVRDEFFEFQEPTIGAAFLTSTVELDDGTKIYAPVVVIASGGFTNNKSILSRVLQSTSLTPTHWSASQYETGQGDAFLWSEKYNLKMNNNDKIGYMCKKCHKNCQNYRFCKTFHRKSVCKTK